MTSPTARKLSINAEQLEDLLSGHDVEIISGLVVALDSDALSRASEIGEQVYRDGVLEQIRGKHAE